MMSWDEGGGVLERAREGRDAKDLIAQATGWGAGPVIQGWVDCAALEIRALGNENEDRKQRSRAGDRGQLKRHASPLICASTGHTGRMGIIHPFGSHSSDLASEAIPSNLPTCGEKSSR
jgi:hypothetical protein